MRRVAVIIGLVISVVVVAACGSGTNREASRSSAGEQVALEVAGPHPSVSARMLCGAARKDIASALGVDTSQPLKPTWVDHVYACDYVYGTGGKVSLSVKEMSSVAETNAYFDALGKMLGRAQKLQGLGEGAFQTTNGSVVVRKDYRVLLVDVSRLQKRFGPQSLSPGDAAIDFASVVMSCWTGA